MDATRERMARTAAGLACALFLFVAAPTRSDVGPGIQLKLLGQPKAAALGEVYEARARITAGRDLEVGDFRAAGEGWREGFVDAPARAALAEGESLVIEFGAIAEDPSQSLTLSFDVDGRPFSQHFDFSSSRIEQLLHGGRVVPVGDAPQPDALPDMTSPGLSHDDLDEDACASLSGELAFIRRELLAIRRELAAMRVGAAPEAAAAEAAGPQRVSIDDDAILGEPRAPVTLLAFSDYQCESCRRFAVEVLPTLRERYIDKGQLRYIVRDFPLANHPQAAEAARVAHCAGQQQKFWAMHDLLFETQGSFAERPWEALASRLDLDLPAFQRCISDPAVKAEVDIDRAAGLTLGVGATPTLFVGPTQSGDTIEAKGIRGVPPIEVLEREIAKALGTEP